MLNSAPFAASVGASVPPKLKLSEVSELKPTSFFRLNVSIAPLFCGKCIDSKGDNGFILQNPGFVSIVRPFCGKCVDSKGPNGFVLQNRGLFNFMGNI